MSWMGHSVALSCGVVCVSSIENRSPFIWIWFRMAQCALKCVVLPSWNVGLGIRWMSLTKMHIQNGKPSVFSLPFSHRMDIEHIGAKRLSIYSNTTIILSYNNNNNLFEWRSCEHDGIELWRRIPISITVAAAAPTLAVSFNKLKRAK